MRMRFRLWLPMLLLCAPALQDARAFDPADEIDLADVLPGSGQVRRVLGSEGDGSFGVPVAGAFDVDGDGHRDVAFSAMVADPLGRTNAGSVYLVFGDGTLGVQLDTATLQPGILRIAGDGVRESAGSEIWMDDVDGDGTGDLLIARQNHDPDPPNRPGAGALTILFGGPEVRTLATALAAPGAPDELDLRAPDPSLALLTLVGGDDLDRLGIWMRTGDVTGDGIADIVVAADQVDGPGGTHSGEVYVIRGGAHLRSAGPTVDLASFGATALAGDLMRITAPASDASHYHFGATCQIGDLDGNGRAEVMAAAALNRAGASLLADGAPVGSAHATGGTSYGTLYIAWDDNFTGDPWPAGFSFDIELSPGTRTVIDGTPGSKRFGEEILAGRDYDCDGEADLFVGDITGDLSGDPRPNAGAGHVFWDADQLAGQALSLPPPGSPGTTTFLGGAAGNIAADTALHGDFDGDGCDDLSFSSPHAAPFGRIKAGTIHVFLGRAGGWPGVVDLKPGELPDPGLIHVTNVYGAQGTAGSDGGDTLAYSAAAGDVDGDGLDELITNEMLGNGSSAEDVGNLLLLSGRLGAGVLLPAATPVATLALALSLLAGGLLGARLRR